MSPSEAKEFYRFVTKTLPNLLSKFDDPMASLERLGELWRENRKHEIEDRSDEVAENRSEVDKRLEERRAQKERRNQTADE